MVREIIASIYDGVKNPRAWTIFLGRLAEASDSMVCALVIRDARSIEDLVITSGKELQRIRTRGDPQLSAAFVASSETSPLSYSHPAPVKKAFQAREITVFSDGIVDCRLVFLHQCPAPAPTRRELRLIEQLVPHVTRAVQYHCRLAALEAADDCLREFLDRLPFGVILYGKSGNVLRMNRCAQGILALSNGLTLDSHGLSARRMCETTSLKSLMERAFESSSKNAVAGRGRLMISRVSGRSSYSVVVAPLSPQNVKLAPPETTVAVFITDQERITAELGDVLHSLFALTPVQERIASMLVAGKLIKDVSSELKITQDSARKQLKTIFRKTQTNRQSELMRFLLTTAATI